MSTEAKFTPGPWFTIDLESSIFMGVGRKATSEESLEAQEHGRFDDPPMSILGISAEGLAAVDGHENAHLIAAALAKAAPTKGGQGG